MNIKNKTGVILVLWTILFRALYWFVSGGIKYGGDSGSYLEKALSISQGNIPSFTNTTHLPLFSFLLAPSYLLPISFPLFFFFYELFFSVATVWLLYLFAKKWGGEQYALLVGAIASVYPSLLFWFPYVLSDTTFVFLLALFIVALVYEKKVLSVLSALVLLLCRPHAVAIVGALCAYYLFNWIYSKGGKRGLILVLAICLGAGTFMVRIPAVSDTLLRSTFLMQPLWFGTKRTTNIEEMFRVHEEEARIAKLASESNGKLTQIEYKAAEAVTFITQNPTEYLRMTIERFFCYWFPWAFATQWSLLHRLVEIFQSLFLTLGFFMGWVYSSREQKKTLPLLLSMAIGLSLLAMICVADTDVRYRFPAEIILLVIAPWGWTKLLGRLRRKGFFFLRLHPIKESNERFVES